MRKFFISLIAMVWMIHTLPSQSAFLDPSFGNGGIALPAGFEFPSGAQPTMALQPDGKILVQDVHSVQLNSSNKVLSIHRFLPDGSLDQSFGQGGTVNIGVGPFNVTTGNDLTLLPNGKILIGYYTFLGPIDSVKTTVIQLNPNGSVDTSFGSNGQVNLIELTGFQIDSPLLHDVEVQSNGRIVLIYHSHYSLYAEYGFRLLQPNGTIVPGYEEVNWWYTENIDEFFTQALIQPDDKILVGGFRDPISGPDVEEDFLLERFESHTFVDDNFGLGGYAIADNNGQPDRMYDMLLEPDGSVIAAGNTGSNNMMLAKFQSNGALDPSFGTNGKVVYADLLQNYFYSSLSRSSDGRIVLSGWKLPYTANTAEAAVVRLMPSGAIDTTFTPDGLVYLPFAETNFYSDFYGATVLPDRRIQACGIAYTPTKQLMLVRFLPEADATIWYRDQDGDGYGSETDSVFSTEMPMGYIVVSGDCNDLNVNVNPGAAEICGNNLDDNCDGLEAGDTEPPVAICKPSIKRYLDASGAFTLDPSLLDDGSTDNCSSTLSFSASRTQFDCSDHLTPTPITLTVTDLAGNSSTCTTLVKMADTINLTAVCLPILKLELDPYGHVSLNPADLDGGSYDNCATLTTFHTDVTEFGCSDWGIHVITLTITDANNDVNTCTSVVKVVDNWGPTVICPEFTTVGLDASGIATLDPNDLDLGTYDGCSGTNLLLSIDLSHFDCTDIGDHAVTLRAEDEYGNTNACTTTLTVTDKKPPVAVCHENFTIALDPTGNALLDPADLNLGSYDNCSTALVFTADKTAFDCEDLGDQPVTFSVTDSYGNSQSCQVTVSVVDKLSPLAICNDSLALEMADNGLMTLIPNMIDAGSSDNCGVMNFQVDPAQLSSSNLGSNVVTLSVADASGNVSSCTTIVMLTENTSGTQNLPGFSGLKVYPNPSTGRFELRFEEGFIFESVEIFNAAGQRIGQKTQSATSLTFDLSDQTSGCYYLRVQSGEKVQVLKLMLVH